MSIQRIIFAFTLIICFCLQEAVAQAGNVGFSGLVLPNHKAEVQVVETTAPLVSFSDQVALGLPYNFGKNNPVHAYDHKGKAVAGVQLLPMIADNGSVTRIAIVDLLDVERQTVLVCDQKLCIRFKVLRQ
ncbi:MAG: hypothetical protein AAF423_08455 [Pseudomonadota bacterium]